MKLDSSYFDSIRIKREAAGQQQTRAPRCQRRNCANPGLHKAPMGRGREGEFYLFCLEHVRDYNKRYNYFDGMSDDDVVAYQKSSMTGHRPTWTMGANSSERPGDEGQGADRLNGFDPRAAQMDPHELFKGGAAKPGAEPLVRRRPIGKLERKCLHALNLEDDASSDQIKAEYKEQVKRHHPDANGGDRRSEDKLREVIQAYNYLKQTGLC